ncbi:MAG: bifunctional folylpolyglutamate synthase/dihydrofolate synthase [Proteobacteria bacterium]|nr:bifunctional folylpolyglutamate synthase/dihydrofolate synthase [Pseudomonadota bacterium]
MTFAQALDWLNSTQFTGIKLGLENTQRLLDAVGNPERHLRFLHVAGTNGKGSVCAMLDACLRASGLKTGLYTSPHLVDFRERVRLNGRMISREETADGLTRLRESTCNWDHEPTFFELSTVLAIDFFKRSHCDVVVLETGMGGRLDSTNVITPLVSVITPIAMDHMSWLGDSIEKIASEKAGIIKPQIPVISSPQQSPAMGVLIEKAHASGSQLHVVNKPLCTPVALPGAHQLWNAAVAVAALDASGLNCPTEAISQGLSTVQWPARFQKLGERIVIDGAHNEHSAHALVSTWIEFFNDAKATVIFGALSDKNYTEMLIALQDISRDFLFVPVKSERGLDPEVLPPCTDLPSRTFPDLESAVETALRTTAPILITGSLFLAGESLEFFEQKCPDLEPLGHLF